MLGEFYWRVRRGETARLEDYECRTGQRVELLSREQTGDEIVWSHGRRIEVDELARGFALTPDDLSRLQHADGGGLQAVSARPALVKIALGVLLLLLLMALLKSCSVDNCQGYLNQFGPDSAEYRECLRHDQGSGVRLGNTGGSFGGYTSGSGGHK